MVIVLLAAKWMFDMATLSETGIVALCVYPLRLLLWVNNEAAVQTSYLIILYISVINI